jgi:hypothetical protein
MTENTLAAEVAQDVEAIAPASPETAAPAAADVVETTAAPEAGETDDGDDKRRNRRSAQERIAQLTRQKRERDEEIERLRQQVAKAPQEADFGGDYDAFERAKAKHAVREALVDERADLAKAETARIETAIEDDWKANVEDFKARAPDFFERISRPDLPITPAMANTIKAMGPDGPALAYHLASNPAEAARVAALPAYVAAAELGRLAERIKAPARRIVSSAPPPVSPVVGSGGPVEKSPSEMTYAEHRAWRMGKR